VTGFYSLPQPRVWEGKRLRREGGGGIDPYAPSQPDHARRNRRTETEIAPGVLRIDLGDPLPRQSHEPQPVTREGPAADHEEPDDDPADLVLPSLASIEAGLRDWRDDYGISRDRAPARRG